MITLINGDKNVDEKLIKYDWYITMCLYCMSC